MFEVHIDIGIIERAFEIYRRDISATPTQPRERQSSHDHGIRVAGKAPYQS